MAQAEFRAAPAEVGPVEGAAEGVAGGKRQEAAAVNVQHPQRNNLMLNLTPMSKKSNNSLCAVK